MPLLTLAKIEEALKLYQNALKLHSQGPQFFDEAEEAYSALFRSEIFTYFESLSEAQRIEAYGDDADNLISGTENSTADPVVAAPNADGSASTLPQILYLSYKNHGHFILDRLKYQILDDPPHDLSKGKTLDATKPFLNTITSSLELLVEALNRDDTDVELWRQLSRIGESLGSRRLARFCLEAVLYRDDVSGDAWPEPLGLQEIFATEMLRKLLQLLNDDASESTMTTLTRKQQNLVRSFKANLDPLPYLPTPPPEPPLASSTDQMMASEANAVEIAVTLRNWASCGKAILLQLQKEAQGLVNADPGAHYSLVLPPSHTFMDQKSSEIKTAPATNDNGLAITNDDTDTADAMVHGNHTSLPLDEAWGRAQNMSPEAAVLSKPLPESGAAEVAGTTDAVLEKVTPSDENVTNAMVGQETAHFPGIQDQDARTMTLPTRKRSNEAAELDEGEEDTGRSKSKRIKARASIEEPGPRKDHLAKQLEQWQQGELRYLDHVDEQAFDHSAALLSVSGIHAVNSAREPKADVLSLVGPKADRNAETSKIPTKGYSLLWRDLALSLDTWNTHMSTIFLHGTGFEDPISGVGATRRPDILVFLEQSAIQPRGDPSQLVLMDDRGLEAFADRLDQGWVSLNQLAMAWVKAFLAPEDHIRDTRDTTASSAYEAFLWPDNLKETIVQLLVKEDEFIFEALSGEAAFLAENRSDVEVDLKKSSRSLIEVVQNIFELHLDIYGRITNPNSEVDTSTRTGQRDRLQRWASLAHRTLKWEEETNAKVVPENTCSIRFLWAYAVLADLCESCSGELVRLYFQDLGSALRNLGSPVIKLHNNAIIPEISVEAAEKKISRLITMDFFVNVFSPNKDDPVALIESLEPILEKSSQRIRSDPSALNQTADATVDPDVSNDMDQRQADGTFSDISEPYKEQTLQFLDKASLSMRLLLWRKLIDAYSVIQYTPRIFVCYLRCLGLITNYLQSPQYMDQSEDNRQKGFFRWLRSLDDLLRWTLALALTDAKSLDCMDEANLRDAMSDLATLQYILHAFVAWDDLIRTGLRDAPKQPNNSANTAHSNAMDKFRDMVIKVWTLQYVLLRESAAQTSTDTPATNRGLVSYLKLTHKSLGSRNYCKLSNKVLVRLTKQEISRMDNFVDSEVEAAQLILDLYGLKVCPGSKEVDDHGCPAENLDRHNAIEIMDRVLVQAYRLNNKDLIKSELRNTIEKMQEVIKVPRITPLVRRNEDTLDGFLISPINPLSLSRALRGIGELPYQKLHGESFQIAEKGWYFLQGYMALSKFRSQRRTVPGMTQDLDTAEKFFRHDLFQGFEKWETWYRLAQVYDARIEEHTTWSSEKMNDSMLELVTLQRNAIHCYTMAVATAERCAEPSFDMFQKVADLYSDFGIRVYGSSREPFSMEAFSVEGFTKHFNGTSKGMYQGQPFKPVSLYVAWRFARTLLRRALVHKPDSWMYVCYSNCKKIS